MSGRLLRALTPLVRWRYPLLYVWTGLWIAVKPRLGADWGWFVLGSDLLFGRHPQGLDKPGGLHLYGSYPEIHPGPLSFLVVIPFRAVSPDDGRRLAILAIAALGPLLVLLVERTAVAARGYRTASDDPLLPLATLIGGGVFLVAWTEEVAVRWAHMDEALVVAAAAIVAWCAATRSRPLLAGVATGLACGFLSWAVFFLPLFARFGRREALRAAAVALALAAAAWLPFFIADPHTIAVGRANLGNSPDSGLRIFGVDSATTPHWLRPVQVVVALALASLAVASGRWAAALLVAIGSRIALDSAVFTYYTAPLVLAALIWDLAGRRRPLPVWTIATWVALEVVRDVVDDPHVRGAARVAVVAAAILAVFALPRVRTRASPATLSAG